MSHNFPGKVMFHNYPNPHPKISVVFMCTLKWPWNLVCYRSPRQPKLATHSAMWASRTEITKSYCIHWRGYSEVKYKLNRSQFGVVEIKIFPLFQKLIYWQGLRALAPAEGPALFLHGDYSCKICVTNEYYCGLIVSILNPLRTNYFSLIKIKITLWFEGI